MNRFAALLAAAAAAVCCTFAAQAGTRVNAADLPHISNGGTGYIGLTESATTPDRLPKMSDAATTRAGSTPPMSQEARADQATLRTLGSGAAPAADARMHRAWGTPD